MTKFNLSKIAKKVGYRNYNTMLTDQTDDMGLLAEVPSKNINLNMPVKNKDNTVLFEKQLEANRKDEKEPIVTERSLDTSKKVYNEKRQDKWNTNVMPINLATEVYDQEKAKAIIEAEDKQKKDTIFWDKYVGVQMEGPKTTVDRNIPKSQLQNSPDRFKNLGKGESTNKTVDTEYNEIDKKYDEMVTASLRDADAMLFHIYATATNEDRDLNEKEKQLVSNINNGKVKIISSAAQVFLGDAQLAEEDANRDIAVSEGANLEMKVNSDGSVNILQQGSIIDVFNKYPDVESNVEDAKASYYPDLDQYGK